MTDTQYVETIKIMVNNPIPTLVLLAASFGGLIGVLYFIVSFLKNSKLQKNKEGWSLGGSEGSKDDKKKCEDCKDELYTHAIRFADSRNQLISEMFDTIRGLLIQELDTLVQEFVNANMIDIIKKKAPKYKDPIKHPSVDRYYRFVWMWLVDEIKKRAMTSIRYGGIEKVTSRETISGIIRDNTIDYWNMMMKAENEALPSDLIFTRAELAELEIKRKKTFINCVENFYKHIQWSFFEYGPQIERLRIDYKIKASISPDIYIGITRKIEQLHGTI